MIPLITLEEHFFSSHIKDWSTYGYSEQFKHLPGVVDKLLDLDSLRLASMDENAISIQVLSHGPGLAKGDGPDPLGDCRRANDEMADAVRRHPTRYAALAVLPMSMPDAAAKELARCVTELNFRGALVDNHVSGKHYESPRYHIFWRTAEALNVPIYLHPTWPSPDIQLPQYQGDILASATASLGSSGWGWHADVGNHVLKLFAAGVFDLFPKLKIIVGHMGEMLPFMLERIEYLSQRWAVGSLNPKLTHRPFGQVWKENIWITTSGCWSVAPIACILRNTAVEHVLYSVDYPFAKNEDGLKFMEELERSGLVTREQFEQIGYRNAEQLLGIKVSTEL
jgi:predicted TIM-barrel fold metal-dependent hydrolase